MADSFRTEGGREPLDNALRPGESGSDRPGGGGAGGQVGLTWQIPSDSQLSAKLHEVEAARAYAERQRQLFRLARQEFVAIDSVTNQDYLLYASVAVEYARAADRAEDITSDYEAAVAERWRADLEREKLPSLDGLQV